MFFENKLLCYLNKNGFVLKVGYHTNSKGCVNSSEE